MSLRTWLAKQLNDLIEQPASPVDPPTSSPASTPTSLMTSTRTSEPTSVAPDTLVVIETMGRMQADMMKEIRGMVTDILQGRERPAISEAEQLSASRMLFDPPSYDDPGTEDLPPGIQEVFRREEREDIAYRSQSSEPELLRNQLEHARRAAGLDAQGPTPGPSFSTESLGLQWDQQNNHREP